MSVHNHDEEIMKRFGNTPKGRYLKKKVDTNINSRLVETVLNTDISGLSKQDARKKLNDALEKEFDGEG